MKRAWRNHNSMRTMRVKQTHGFSVLEVILVVVLIGILGAAVIPRFLMNTRKAKISACDMNRAIINTSVEMYRFTEATWPVDSLSDIKTNFSYFPDGIPTCPIDLTSYSLTPSPVHRVAGHRQGDDTHSSGGSGGGGGGGSSFLLNSNFDTDINNWNIYFAPGGSLSYSPLYNNSAHINMPNSGDGIFFGQDVTQDLHIGDILTVTFFMPVPAADIGIGVFTGIVQEQGTWINVAAPGWYTVNHTLTSNYLATGGYNVSVWSQSMNAAGQDIYVDTISIH